MPCISSAFIDALETVAVVAAPEVLPELPDRDDAIYLAAATDGGASVLVTGNARHFPQAMCGAVTVLAPAAFLDLLAAIED